MTRHSRPRNDRGFFKGWDFQSWGQAIASAALIVLACIGSLTLIVGMFVASDRNTYAYDETLDYWVEQGDTLWKIAREYSTPRQDVRRVIQIIEEESDCTATIYPGQHLTIPVFH